MSTGSVFKAQYPQLQARPLQRGISDEHKRVMILGHFPVQNNEINGLAHSLGFQKTQSQKASCTVLPLLLLWLEWPLFMYRNLPVLLCPPWGQLAYSMPCWLESRADPLDHSLPLTTRWLSTGLRPLARILVLYLCIVTVVPQLINPLVIHIQACFRSDPHKS